MLRYFGLREDRKKNFEVGKRYREEAIMCGRKAVEYLEGRVKNNARDIDAYSQLIELYAGLGEIQNAQRCCHAILAMDSDEPWANYYMGLTLEKGNPTLALKYFKKAIDKKPDMPFFHAKLIGILMSLGQYAECLLCIDEAIGHLPYEPTFYTDDQKFVRSVTYFLLVNFKRSSLNLAVL